MAREANWTYMEDKSGQDGWRCSNCRFFVPWYYEYYESNYFIDEYCFCPRCGAEMRAYTGMKEAQPVYTIHFRPRL